MTSSARPVLVYVPDLLMRQQVVEGLQAAGIAARGTATQARFDAALAEGPPAAIVVELDGVGIDGVGLVERLTGDPASALAPVIGFCAHTRVELITEARAAGAAKVVSRGELVRRLPDLVAGVMAKIR